MTKALTNIFLKAFHKLRQSFKSRRHTQFYFHEPMNNLGRLQAYICLLGSKGKQMMLNKFVKTKQVIFSLNVPVKDTKGCVKCKVNIPIYRSIKL